MKADSRCDACGAYVSTGHGVVRRRVRAGEPEGEVQELFFHTSCIPKPLVRRKTGYEGTRPKEQSPIGYVDEFEDRFARPLDEKDPPG